MALEDRGAQHKENVDKFIGPAEDVQMTTFDYVVRPFFGIKKVTVKLATAAALPACTASGSGVGKKLTMDAAAVLAVDGVNTVLNDRILVKNQAVGKDNGVYKVTTEGTVGVAAVLTRSTDMDEDAEVVSGTYVGVTAGTANGNKEFVLSTADPITVDTTALVFTVSAGDFTITLPPVAEAKGRIYSISARNILTVVDVITIADKNDSEGWTDLLLDTTNDSVLFYSDGIRWWIIGGVIA